MRPLAIVRAFVVLGLFVVAMAHMGLGALTLMCGAVGAMTAEIGDPTPDGEVDNLFEGIGDVGRSVAKDATAVGSAFVLLACIQLLGLWGIFRAPQIAVGVGIVTIAVDAFLVIYIDWPWVLGCLVGAMVIYVALNPPPPVVTE